MFYDGDLIDATGPEARSLIGWEGLPNPKFPIIFHGVDGENEREGNSPSWFNQSEILQAMQYVRFLCDSRRVRPEEIGIISPYQKQVKKLRIALSLNRLYNSVTVGSCEQFQGQERRVIIITTVRTNSDLLESDRRHNLGFLSNPKRFNVAVTRAKSLLILIGSPQLLMEDPYWSELIRLCISRSGVAGIPPPSDEDIQARGHMLQLIRENQGEPDESGSDGDGSDDNNTAPAADGMAPNNQDNL